MTSHIGSESLWDRLRNRREELGISIDEVARVTRISAANLKAMELGDPDRLPAPIYIKGFIRAYARQLELDEKELVQQYISRYEPEPEELTLAVSTAPDRSNLLLPVLVVGLLLLAILAGGGYYVYRRMIEPARPIAAGIPAPIPQAQPQPAPAKAQEDTAAAAPENASATPAEQAAAPAAKETTAQSPPPEPPKTAAPVPMAAPAPASAPAGPAGRHTLKAVVHAQTWLRIDTDGQTIRQVLLRPGESLSWEADQYFRLRVGNAGGIVLFLDGEQLPALGGSGEVRDLTLPAGRGTKP
jgi:cytoskeleton protein RodZ